MEAGRELDELIAAKLFQGMQESPLITPDATTLELWHLMDGQGAWSVKPLPHYSTDIAAAWEVVEKLQGGLWFELRRRPDGGFWAYFGQEMSAEAETAPHAICLAALKAVGG